MKRKNQTFDRILRRGIGVILLLVISTGMMLVVIRVLRVQVVGQVVGQDGATRFPATSISIVQNKFAINGELTYRGTSVEGLLFNSRMIQGIFDDENPVTAQNWAYPDTKQWEPQRNTNELVRAIPSYARAGLKLITVGMQGGCPRCDSANGVNVSTAFNADGSLKQAWLHRLDQVIRAADANGMVVNVSLFYAKQNKRLSSEQTVIHGINTITDWLIAGGYTNVFVEIANECNIRDFYPYLSSHVTTAIQQAQTRSHGKLKVSVSYTGGTIPPAAVISQEDYITIHGNGQTPSQITEMVAAIRSMPAYQSNPKPIIFDEDSSSIANMNAAIQSHASWGYYDQGRNNYFDGFQSPPINWTINTAAKEAFFRNVGEKMGGGGPQGSPLHFILNGFVWVNPHFAPEEERKLNC
jgi:hypothetical protein